MILDLVFSLNQNVLQLPGAVHTRAKSLQDGLSIVAITRWNSTCSMLTSAKLSEGYLVVRITRELDKEPSLHCYPIYISYR